MVEESLVGVDPPRSGSPSTRLRVHGGRDGYVSVPLEYEGLNPFPERSVVPTGGTEWGEGVGESGSTGPWRSVDLYALGH